MSEARVLKLVNSLKSALEAFSRRYDEMRKERDQFFFVLAALLHDLPEQEIRIPREALRNMQPFEMDYRIDIQTDNATDELVVGLGYGRSHTAPND